MRPPKRLARSVTSAIRSVAVAGAVVVTILTAVVSGQTSVRDVLVIAPEHPAIEYWTRVPDNPVSWLATRLERGEAGLAFRNDGSGYLLSLLRQLDINPDSLTEQGSRGVYFSDDVAISRADTGAFEIIATDPWLGAAFYTVAAGLVGPAGPPLLARPRECAECHHAAETLGVPGLLAGVASPTAIQVPDPVALLTWRHQAHVINLLTRLAWESQVTRHSGVIGYSLAERMKTRVDEVVAYMLFVNNASLEASLDTPVEAQSTFVQSFPRRGPHDRDGRSLRDFDLETRLFRYPLSYMIYSRAFDAIEPVVREFLLRRLFDVLSGGDPRPMYAGLSFVDRQAILTILRDTKPNLPTYWRERRP
jgi:hypothetical protein